MAWREKYLVAAKTGDRIEKGHPGRTARYRVVWRNPDGSKQSKGGFTLAKDADSYALEVERKESLGGLYKEAPQTFGEFFDGWKDRYKPTVRPSSYKRRMETQAHLSDLWDLTFDRVTPAVVEDLVMGIAAQEMPRQAQYVLQTIKMVLRNASLRNQPVNPQVLQVKPPVYESRRKQFLEQARVDELADGTTEPRLIRFTVLTGLRWCEVSGLTEDHVTLGDRGLRISRDITKTDAGVRTVPLTADARHILKEQRLARPAGSKVLFPAPEGGHWAYANFYNRVWAAKDEEGNPATARRGEDFHDLRHTFAAWMIAAGTHPKVLQTVMGHESIKTTLDTYGHLYDDAATEAMDALHEHLQRGEDTDENSAAGTDSGAS